MKNYNFTSYLLFWSLVLFFCTNAFCFGQSVPTNSSTKTISLFDYLETMAPNLGYYYTIEKLQSETGSSVYSSAFVTNDQNVKSINGLIAKLQKELQGISVYQDKNNPSILHFVDDGLKHDKKYTLSLAASIKFSGKLVALPDKLGRHLNTDLFTQTTFATPVSFFDYKTQINYTANNEQVRDILSNCVPLTKYSYYIWFAQTYMASGRMITTVAYNGDRKNK